MRLHVVVATVLVHQEADRAQLHAEHRLAQVPMPVQGLQHEAVAPSGHSTSACSGA
jgi:hypothetical protein